MPVSTLAVVVSMNFRHISAGNVPPCTLMPCTSVIGTLPDGKPIHTAAVSRGV